MIFPNVGSPTAVDATPTTQPTQAAGTNSVDDHYQVLTDVKKNTSHKIDKKVLNDEAIEKFVDDQKNENAKQKQSDSRKWYQWCEKHETRQLNKVPPAELMVLFMNQTLFHRFSGASIDSNESHSVS